MLDFYRGKRIFLTGHTGFKGMWLAKMLIMSGAEVTGYALPSPTKEGDRVMKECGVLSEMRSVTGDVCDAETLKRTFQETRPEIVIHLAAQPLVLEGYRDPVRTYGTNVMGTVNLLECIRQMSETDNPVRSVVNVTTDKVYENKEWPWGYRENEPLDGYDPYSNSKSCSELVTHCYQKSFLQDKGIAVSTVRAGNVIGGGDYSANRIMPDAVRAARQNLPIQVRNPFSIRPYQHVLEPLYAYLLIAQKQYEQLELASAYNVGPDECDCVSTGELMNIFCAAWGNEQTWESHAIEQPHEASVLKLDCSKLKQVFCWHPRWHIREAVHKATDWYRADIDVGGKNVMEQQIREYIGEV